MHPTSTFQSTQFFSEFRKPKAFLFLSISIQKCLFTLSVVIYLVCTQWQASTICERCSVAWLELRGFLEPSSDSNPHKKNYECLGDICAYVGGGGEGGSECWSKCLWDENQSCGAAGSGLAEHLQNCVTCNCTAPHSEQQSAVHFTAVYHSASVPVFVADIAVAK